MTNQSVKAAKEAMFAANRELAQAKAKLREAKDAECERLDREFGPKILELEAAAKAAKEAFAAAESAAVVPHEWEGRRVFRVVSSTARSSMRRRDVREEGIVETVTAQSKFAANKKWGLPRIGEVIVREVKKDGTASPAYHGRITSPFQEASWNLCDEAS